MLVIALGGCGLVGTDEASEAGRRAVIEANERVGERLEEKWADLPGVVEVDTGYAWNPEDKGFRAAVSCRACDVEAVFDEVAGDVWRSEVAQMPAFTVEVWHVEDPEVGKSHTYVLPEDAARLEDAYGPRPPLG